MIGTRCLYWLVACFLTALVGCGGIRETKGEARPQAIDDQTVEVRNAVRFETRDGQLVDLVLELSVNRVADTYTLSLQNKSGARLMWDDCLRNPSPAFGDMGPGSILARDSAGHVVSKNSFSEEGWWSSVVFVSSARSLPVTLQELKPYETVKGTFKISAVAAGIVRASGSNTHQTDAEWLSEKSLKVTAGIRFIDPSLHQGIGIESPWIAPVGKINP